MGNSSLFNTLAKGTNAVLDVADTAITVIGVPLTFIWGALQTTLVVGAGAALGPLPLPAVLGLAAAGGTLAAGLTYYGSHALTNVFRSSAEDTSKREDSSPDWGWGGLQPA